MTVRLHELAKDLKLTSKELMDKLKSLKVDAKSHMSVIDEKSVKLIKDSLKPVSVVKPAEKKPVAAPAKSALASTVKPTAQSTPSIESAKKELLLQRIGSKKTSAAPVETRKPVPTATSTPAIKRAPETTSYIQKPKFPVVPTDTKKSYRPADAHSPVPHSHTPVAPAAPAIPAAPRKMTLDGPIVVKDLAVRLTIRPSDLIMRLIKLNVFANINQALNFDTAAKVALEFGYELEKSKAEQSAQVEAKVEAKDKSKLVVRAPIVTFMGHVDHGKTSLLDAIRNTKVAAKEAGGITQHIGAYEVFLPKGAVTFLDTPGHEAFTAMRARGARATDVVVLVVAADDSVMPQTLEAIDHAKAAGVPIIVAINKMDLPSANPDRVKKDLATHNLLSEDWGGKTIMVPVSARTGKGIDELLELLVLESELLELRADPSAPAKGVVIEAQLSKESGVLATVLVQDGTLRVGDTVIVGPYTCRVRAMINDRGQRVKEALPSMPVEILGLPGVPKAGDTFYTVKDERTAKDIVEKIQEAAKAKVGIMSHVSLEYLFEGIKSGKVEELKLVIKSDVQGSAEALRTTLDKIQSKNARLSIIHTGTGDITESDVMLAAASDAVVIGFHVDMTASAKEIADRELVDVRFYQIIYEVKTAIEQAMEGLLEPEMKEAFVGSAEVRQVFKVSKVGVIAGCAVVKGKIVRNFSCRVWRANQKIAEGKVESLKRFKDDAREVLEGFECGIGVSNFDDLIAGDRIEVFEVQKKARKLE